MDEKGASSVNRKEKNSFLDDDIGNDFLTSWKSMSVTKDDAMDFGFDTVSSSKNKAFNFDKLDMDFGLDDGFDKLSSFKVDMPDFDLSSPSKKVTIANEKSENKSSAEKSDGKKSKFNFFDFNEMDNFDFESSMGELVKAPIKNKGDKMDISSDATDQQSSKIQLSDGIGVFDDTIATKLPASKGVVTSDVEALLSGPGHLIAKEKDRENTILSEDPILPHSGRSSPAKARNNSVEATDQTILPEKAISMDTYSQHARFGFAGPSLIGADPDRNILSDRQTQNTRLGTEIHSTSGQKENANSKIVGVSASNETLRLKNPSPPNTTSGSANIRKNVLGTDSSTETVDGNVSALGDLVLTGNPISSVSRKASHDIKDDEGNQNCTTELPSVLQCSESVVVDKVTLLNHNESGSSNFKGEASENPPCQAALLETKSHSSDSESMASTNKSLATETENSIIYNEPQAGINSGDNLESVVRELSEGENMLIAGANSVKYLNNLRERSSSDVLPNECKLVRTSQFLGEEVAKNKPIISSSDKNVINQNPTVYHVTSDVLPKESKLVVTSQLYGEEEMKKKPTLSTREKNVINQIPTGLSEKQKAKPNSPTSVNPKRLFFSMESMRNAKIKSVEGNKVSIVGSPKKMPELSISKTSMSKGADKVSDSISLSGTSSLQNTKPDMKKLYPAASETAHPFKIAEQKSPPNLSLKRKAFELPSSDLLCLKPLKRLSSPKENRDFQELPRQAIGGKRSREDKNLKPLNCLSKTLGARDVKEPMMKRVDVEESLSGAEVEKVCVREIQENNAQNNLNIVPMMTVVESPQEANMIEEVNVMELELSLTIKDDGSVEKAEAYAKELEDICNMLRKKHGEAREILVRALVNNNNLLMLNHPIYEEKICKVQKFAAEVMSKELKT